MTKSFGVRAATAALVAVSAATARAGEGAPEMSMSSTSSLFILLGGVAAMGVVVWLLVKFLNK